MKLIYTFSVFKTSLNSENDFFKFCGDRWVACAVHIYSPHSLSSTTKLSEKSPIFSRTLDLRCLTNKIYPSRNASCISFMKLHTSFLKLSVCSGIHFSKENNAGSSSCIASHTLAMKDAFTIITS